MVSGDAGFDIFRHHSGKGTDKGEKKAGNLVSSHVLWLTWLPVQVRLAAPSEAALVGILMLVGWQLQPAAASLLVIVFGLVNVAAAALFGIFTLGRDFCFPAFVFSLIEENVAALLNHGVDDSHDLVYSSSDVGTDEGLNRHVLAGSLFSGTGEQASGRVDVPGKDNQQHAAAAIVTICFFVKSLGAASYVVKMEHHAIVARVKQHVALKSGVREDAFYLVWEGRVLRDGDTLGCLVVVRDKQLHMCSYLRGGVGMGRQPQIFGQWVCQSCGMGGCWPTRQSCFRCGAPRRGGNGGQRPPRESHYPGQPSNQRLPINPTKRVLRGFSGGTSQSPPKVLPTGPVPSSNQGLADPALILPLLQSLGLPEEVLEAVRARIATQKAPKKVSREKELSLLRAKTNVLAQQITRLNKTVLYHQEKLRENEGALSTKQSEHAQLQVEFLDLTDKGFTPTPSPFQTPPQSEHGACDEEGVSDVPMEHTSSDSGAAGYAARPVVGTAKKRRCLGSADVLNEVVEREIAQLSTEETRRFQVLFAQQAEKSKNMEEGTLEILRLQEEEAYERDSVLLGSQG